MLRVLLTLPETVVSKSSHEVAKGASFDRALRLASALPLLKSSNFGRTHSAIQHLRTVD
jgi:hypothetical protein